MRYTDEHVLQGMRKWTVPDVVEQNGDTSALKFFAADVRPFTLQHPQRLLHQVQRAQSVMKTSVERARINVVRHTQLLDAAQTLHPRVVEQIEQNAFRHVDESVNGVVKYFFLLQFLWFNDFLTICTTLGCVKLNYFSHNINKKLIFGLDFLSIRIFYMILLNIEKNNLMKKPLILVTNDDGMFAPGIKALVEVACAIGEVVVVAPNSPQSAKGHAITLSDPLRLHRVSVFNDVEAYECSGTPVDCVKLAKHVILKDRTPDLCVSGINHGSNASINILYSGTMSAAMEAALEGIPSIGFSLLDYTFEADFAPAQHYARQIIHYVLQTGLKSCNLLNVNIPKLPLEAISGIKVCRQANARWKEEFMENTDPAGRKYYWLTGKFINEDTGDDTDVSALENGFVSVVPCGHDLTIYPAIYEMKKLNTAASQALEVMTEG